MAHEDLLVVEREVVDDVVLQRRLGAAEHAGVLQRELLEHHRGDLVFDALAHGARRVKCVVGLELVGVVRRRPVAVQQIPAVVDQDLQVREDLEVGDAPRLDPARVQAGRQVRLRRPPRADQSAARDPLDRIHVLRREQPAPGARRGHQAVRPVELEVPAFERRVGLAHLGRAPAASAATARGSTPGRRRRRSSSCCCCARRSRNAPSSSRTDSRRAR